MTAAPALDGLLESIAATCAELADSDPVALAELLAALAPDDATVVERAIARRFAEGWRADPASFAATLDAKFRRWRYVQILADAFRRAADGTSTRQLWMLPARYGKSRMGSVWGPTWYLDRHPDRFVILTSYGHDLALEHAAEVRDLVAEHADTLEVRLKRDRRRAGRWRTTDGGGLMAAGVGGSMTGFGGDIIVVDDPFKNWQEAHSDARREAVWNWYKSVVRTRLQTDDSAIIVVGTRWHEDDLVGRLLDPPDDSEAEAWEVIRMPAIAEAHDPASTDPLERIPDPLGREPGEVLEPERFGVEAVHARRRALGTYLAAAMEQQRPAAPDGEMLRREWWSWYGGLPNPLDLEDWLVSWDMAFKDKASSSYVVGQVWARVGANRYLIDQVRDRMDYPTTRKAVVAFARRWPQARRHLVEDKANGPAIIADLRGVVSGLMPRTPAGSKESRVQAVSADIEAGNVWLPDPGFAPEVVEQFDHGRAGALITSRAWVHEFVAEAANFPNGSHDDQVDAMTQALLEYDNGSAAASSGRATARNTARRRR